MGKFEWEILEQMPPDELARHIALENLHAQEREQQGVKQRARGMLGRKR